MFELLGYVVPRAVGLGCAIGFLAMIVIFLVITALRHIR